MQASKRTLFLISTEKLLKTIFLHGYAPAYTKEQFFEEMNHAIETVCYIIYFSPLINMGY